MSNIAYGGPGEIPRCKVTCPADDFENHIRDIGVVFACQWFGHEPDSAFTAETIQTLRERSASVEHKARNGT